MSRLDCGNGTFSYLTDTNLRLGPDSRPHPAFLATESLVTRVLRMSPRLGPGAGESPVNGAKSAAEAFD